MLRVGIVGLGFMGRMHDRCWRSTPGTQVAAVCEANSAVIAASASSRGGNVAGAVDTVDLTGVEVFNDARKLFHSGLVDAVSITLPTHLHAEVTVQALEAGLHVLCEKPMALTVADCDRMIAASRAHNRLLQVGHCLRFWPEYAVARQLVQGGTLGGVRAATFRRYTAQPAWSADQWLQDEARSGGQIMDLHIHDSDYIHHLFGLPQAVSSVADTPQSYVSTHYHVDTLDAPIVAESCWSMAPSYGFEMSFLIVLENGTIAYDCTRVPTFRVCPLEGEAYTPELPVGDGYARQIDAFARAARGERVEPLVTPEQSRDTVRLVLAEKRSVRDGRPVRVADIA